jgi:pSer/pThr/pTyr-binding forkhead associated (FHA) protein
MDPRQPSELQHTGTLPISGQESVSVAAPGAAAEPERPAWLDDARGRITEPGRYLAYEESGQQIVTPLAQEWTRIGRSLAADIRFDDATVSRRHALVVSQGDGARVLDDRSLNGVFVNGKRVEWSPLTDGDEITIGRHAIYYVDAVTAGATPRTTALTE